MTTEEREAIRRLVSQAQLQRLNTPEREKRPEWNPDTIIAALHACVAAYGRIPYAKEWTYGNTTGPRRPSTRTVMDVFGRWNAMIRAAGYEPNRAGQKLGI